ncbi:hypothetical protein RclHR1_06680010 [Rhizophagus clarus]|uniref:Uncharacterized protein n=1 Tax=Rhizophagus clarus TaxID=94130 RepID=A0A2Z6RTU8_9GLOM|nr:hypothetical protein RclHR1_06680010 [Rhizophagus clarus]GES80001.1 hypothetical protein GLOIN_2v1848236 [Rhizophagus clarus]
MPRADKMKKWTYSELVHVLKFINSNFDIWYECHKKAYIMAAEDANLERDFTSISTKIHSLMKEVEISIETDRQPTSNILRDSEKVYKLVKEICSKTKERKEMEKIREKRSNCNSGGDAISDKKTKPVIMTEDEEEEEKDDDDDEEEEEEDDDDDETSSTSQMGDFPMPIDIDGIKSLCGGKIQEIEKKRKEEIEKISRIESEMIEAGKTIINKYEELRQI